MISTRVRFICLIILIFTTGISAQTYTVNDSSENTSENHSTHQHQNHIALFLGVTSQLEKTGNDFSLGMDYARIFSPSGKWAGSLFAEAIFAKHTEWVFGLVIFRRLGKTFWVRTGPGVEIIQEEDHNSLDHQTKSKVEFLYRIGCGYPIHLKTLTITPSLDIDIVRSSTALVWGINIGKSF